jgi:hypothetical protein
MTNVGGCAADELGMIDLLIQDLDAGIFQQAQKRLSFPS